MDRYFTGEALYGDDLDADGINRWFAEEERGYYDLAENGGDYRYGYHALNAAHGYRHLPPGRFELCLAIGCARGDEVLPLAGRVGEIVALEPAEDWWSDTIGGTPARYLKPQPDGTIALSDDSVDLITCFGVLHHIPNVSRVIAELSRVAKPGAIFLLREPCHSMGDWRKPRRGLTKNERGLSAVWLGRALATNGFEVVRASGCQFPTTPRIAKLAGVDGFNSRLLVTLDSALSRMFGWNRHYHRDRRWKKVAPGSTFYVLRRMR